MTIKLAILKSGENIISDIKEGFYQDKLVCYILENPCEVKITGSYSINGGENQHSISLNRWPLLSKDTTIEIIPEYLITMVDPVDKLKKLYETDVLGDTENENNQNIIIDEQSNSDQSD